MGENMNKRKHLLILVDSYYPNASMNGIIAYRIAEYVKEKYEITVLSYHSPFDNDIDDNFSEKVFNWSWYYEYYLSAKANKKGVTRLWSVLYKLKKILSNIIRNSSSIGVDKFVLKKLLKKMSEIHQKKSVDIILSIAAPFELQVANYYFSSNNPTVESIIYQVDYWSELTDIGLPKILRKYRKNSRLTMEREMASRSKYIMIPFVYEEEKVAESIQSCQLPLLVRNPFIDTNGRPNHDIVNIVYAGSLSKRERNPVNLLKAILKLSKVLDIQMDFYHRGDCSDIINTYSSQTPSIINRGTVSSETAYKAIGHADVLIMIGTPEGKQIAGKTFDYISTGKKIIYVYQNDLDRNVEFLQSYPQSIAVSNDDLIHARGIEAIRDFIEKTGDPIPFSEIEKIFSDSLPKHFCDCYL